MIKYVIYVVNEMILFNADHPSGLKALWMILVSQDDTAYDTDFDMYYSLFITCIYEYYLI
jgi:hypothetical protein